MRFKFYSGFCHCTSGLYDKPFYFCFSIPQPMKWEWYTISLIRCIDIYDKRLCGKAGFHYLYIIYKIHSMRKCLPMHKKSNGHEIRHVIGDINIIRFVLIQVERSPKVGLFPQKRRPPWLLLMFCTTQQGLCLWFAWGITPLCYLPHHQSLSPFCYRSWAHISFSSMFWQPMQLCT